MRHYAIVTQVSLPLENSTGQEQALYVHQEQIETDKVHKSVTTFKDTHIYIYIYPWLQPVISMSLKKQFPTT